MGHRGRLLPAVSRNALCDLRAFQRFKLARSIKERSLRRSIASRVFFTSDEECSLRAIKGVFYPQSRDRLLGAVSRAFFCERGRVSFVDSTGWKSTIIPVLGPIGGCFPQGLRCEQKISSHPVRWTGPVPPSPGKIHF